MVRVAPFDWKPGWPEFDQVRPTGIEESCPPAGEFACQQWLLRGVSRPGTAPQGLSPADRHAEAVEQSRRDMVTYGSGYGSVQAFWSPPARTWRANASGRPRGRAGDHR